MEICRGDIIVTLIITLYNETLEFKTLFGTGIFVQFIFIIYLLWFSVSLFCANLYSKINSWGLMTSKQVTKWSSLIYFLFIVFVGPMHLTVQYHLIRRKKG